MTNGEFDVGPRGQRFGPGEGPQTLAQLEATGAEIVGSDGEKVGDLKSVGDAGFLVERTLRRDLHVPVKHVQEVTTDNKVVLDVPAEQANDIGSDRPAGETDPGADFSENTKVEKGTWGIKKE
jgi:hypothetical protein